MKKQMIAALIATMLLTSCAAQGTQTDSAQTAEQATPTATPEPAYEGPLYEVSYEKIQDTIPAFRNPNISTTVLDDNGYLGMILRTDFAEDGVLNIAYDYHPRGNGTNGYYRYFCTTDLQPVPIEGDYDFLGYGNGYYLFAHEVGDDHNQRYVQLYDSDFNLVYDSTGAYDLQNWGPCNIYLNTGWMPGEKLATGEEGYFNLFTQEWRALPSDQHLGGLDIVGYNMYSFYSEGLAHVWGNGTHVQMGWTPYTEYPVLGFIDENGDWALRFDDLPAFDNLTVNGCTGFLNGECLICAHDKGYLPSDYTENTDMLYRQYIYRIDKEGNILGETDYESYEQFYVDVMNANRQKADFVASGDGNYRVEEAQIADGLTLRIKNPLTYGTPATDLELNQYELVDCNGHEYDLPEGQISGAIVGDNGVVMLRMNEYLSAEDDGLPLAEHLSETYSPWYTIKLNYIAPDDYTVPADQVQNLTPAEGTPMAEDVMLHTNCEQFVAWMDTGVHDMKLHFSLSDQSEDYTVQDSEYKAWGEDHVQVWVQFHWLDQKATDDYSYEQPVITAEWLDADGNAHQGTYDGYSLTEDEALDDCKSY